MSYEESVDFDICFDRAVSLLSIAGYYVRGFIADSEKKKEEYEIYRRTGSSGGVVVGHISRKGLVKFVEEEKNHHLEDRRAIKIALGLIKAPRHRKKEPLSNNRAPTRFNNHRNPMGARPYIDERVAAEKEENKD